MKTPDESLLARALEALGVAVDASGIAAGASSLIEALGFQRYSIVDMRGGMGPLVNALYHNSPASLAADASSMGGLLDDSVLNKARKSLIPFAWRAGQHVDAWRHAHAEDGYRSGVAAYSHTGNGSGCVVILSWAGDQVPEDIEPVVLAYTLMAAVTLGDRLKRFAVAPQAECPLSERELDCLRYAMAGKSAKETARALGIDARTVQQYLERARSKLRVANSYAAAMAAVRSGWLTIAEAMELSGLAPAGAGEVQNVQDQGKKRHSGSR